MANNPTSCFGIQAIKARQSKCYLLWDYTDKRWIVSVKLKNWCNLVKRFK